MAAQGGEEHVATLFGDVHYFYGPETQKPRHHRFDKESYVYLFENANEGRARIEIANHPGTDDQDAFDGYLDQVHVRYSYKHHCVVSLTVNEVGNQEEWHLPTYDPTNQNIYHYKLHSLDIYFRTQQDALQFVNGIRRVLPPQQVEVLDEPAPPPRQHPLPPPVAAAAGDMSAVVQKLEKAALSGSSSIHQPRAAAAAASNGGVPSFAPPPLSAVSAGTSSTSTPPNNSFAPMAYNPAAPARPEEIRHREKTPPPDDGGVNPLHQRLAADATTPFSPGLAPPGIGGLGPLSPGIPPPSMMHSPPGAPAFPGPPQHSVASPGLPPPGFGSAHQQQHPALARSATMPAQSPSPFSAFPGGPGYAAPPPTAPPPVSSPGLPPPPPAPAGAGGAGHSSYTYGARPAAAAAPPAPQDFSIHQQFYQPGEGEAAVKYKGKTEPRGKLEENAGRLERGVSGMLKKFEKKFG